MVEVSARTTKESLWTGAEEQRKRGSPGGGFLSVRLEWNEETDGGVGRGRGARGGGRRGGDARRHLVPARRRCPGAASAPRRFGPGRNRGQKENAGAPRCARYGDADRQR